VSHNGTLSTVANWYLNQLATYGWLPVLAVQYVAAMALYCGIGAYLNRGRS
jgi:hypothetical protein